MDNISLCESHISLFHKFFDIGEIKIGPKVITGTGMTYGRVQIISRKPNPFLGDYQYISIYDDDNLGCYVFSSFFEKYLSATSTRPSTLYLYLSQIYASADKEFLEKNNNKSWPQKDWVY
jgi:hypothetical protein